MSRPALAFKPPRQRRSHESLERILDAAESLIRERGFDAMTIAEVVQLSGSSVGSIYARFNNKIGLLQAVQVRYHARVQNDIFAAFSGNHPDDESLDEAVGRIVTRALPPRAQRAGAVPGVRPAGRLRSRGAGSGRADERRAQGQDRGRSHVPSRTRSATPTPSGPPAGSTRPAWRCFGRGSPTERERSCPEASPMRILVAELTRMVTSYLAVRCMPGRRPERFRTRF